jgi:hypothetical protein
VKDHITRYDSMPIPPVPAQTEYIDAGVIRFGVEYRLLTDAIAAASATVAADGADAADPETFDDRGVSIHVYGDDGAGPLEFLRFDCFAEDPHYHYVSWKDRTNEMLHLDPVADGDPLAWALERIRTRLPQMLERAGAAHVAARLDPRRLEDALPRVAEAAYRARYHHDDAAVLRDALRAPGASR